MPEPIFSRLALIGIGLIGSSIALAARKAGVVGHVAIHSRTEKTLKRAEELKLGDSFHADPAAAARAADCIIACVPVGASGEVAMAIASVLEPGAIVSDVGSVKASVIAQMKPHIPPGVHFVPAHPVAGTEYSGPDAGFAELFQNRWCILTPPPDTAADAVGRLGDFWRAIGANVEVMSAAHHDLVLAITSHVPHLIAYTIVNTVSDLEAHMKAEVVKFAASGFRDFTRVAASDPVMWRDIFLANKEPVLEMLGRLYEDIALLQKAIRFDDGETLQRVFARSRQIRRSIVQARQD